MSITTPITQVPVAIMERTWRVNIEAPTRDTVAIEFYRETQPLDADNNAIGAPTRSYLTVLRRVADVPDETVQLADGTVLSMAQIIEALMMFGDRWSEADREAAAKPPLEPTHPIVIPPEVRRRGTDDRTAPTDPVSASR